MRVDESTLTDQVSSTASRAAESQRVQVDTSGLSNSSGTSVGDRVDLSSLAGRISQAMQSLSSQSSQRVSQLQKDYQAGRYQADPQQISHAMLSELSGTAGS
jgi:anti-sigma28 factor (negative regulator of flagellin synthesis)